MKKRILEHVEGRALPGSVSAFAAPTFPWSVKTSSQDKAGATSDPTVLPLSKSLSMRYRLIPSVTRDKLREFSRAEWKPLRFTTASRSSGSGGGLLGEDELKTPSFWKLLRGTPLTPQEVEEQNEMQRRLVEEERQSSTTFCAHNLEVKELERELPRYMRPGYKPLPTSHPAFGQVHNVTEDPVIFAHQRRKPLLSTVHHAFGDPLPMNRRPARPFQGRVTLGGFFLSLDPNVCVFNHRDKMNPNAHVTVSDDRGYLSRPRYKCMLEASSGVKLEVLLRCQVGWISPSVKFAEMPMVIHLGRGIDISVPMLFHFTMIEILDEGGHGTGSHLYFSGTPWMGFSGGLTRLHRGRMTLNLMEDIDVVMDTNEFLSIFGHQIHVKQLGFVGLKIVSWLLCMLFCIPYFDLVGKSKRFVYSKTPEKLLPLLRWMLPIDEEEVVAKTNPGKNECDGEAGQDSGFSEGVVFTQSPKQV